MNQDYVLLLHGLGRTKRSMQQLEQYLSTLNYRVININYPSRKKSIEQLSTQYLKPVVEKVNGSSNSKIHIVTHSMGAILVRYFLQDHSLPNGSRVVMLVPPNRGSEIAQKLKNIFLFKWLTGKAGQQLTTDKKSLPNQLKNITLEVGVIAGTKSIIPGLSLFIEDENDGLVSVERTRLTGMKDFLVLPYSHTFIMNAEAVHQYVAHFLHHGIFGSSVEDGAVLRTDKTDEKSS